MKRDYFLGIDGGGTKTEAVLVNEDDREIARAVSGPSNHHTVGWTRAQASLREAIERVLTVANLAMSDVTAIGLGMAGVARPGDREMMQAIVSCIACHARVARNARIARIPHVVITHDAECALVGGVGQRYGVVLIAGTGAIAYGVNSCGQSRRADGWGYLIGDEGSAYWIGQEGLRAAARAYDGRGPATELEGILVSKLGLADASALVTLVYADDFGGSQVAGLAPLVSQAAQSGDAVAQRVLREAGRRLSNTLSAVIRGLNMTAETFEAVLTGGVFFSESQVRDTVVAALGTIAPNAQAIAPRHDAAFGAALLAQQVRRAGE